MTVSSTTTKNSYSGNGSTTVFAYGFKVFDEDDLTVILRTDATGAEAVQSITTHYTVSGVGAASGGNVTFGAAPASGVTVVIRRASPLTQTTDYTPNDPFPAASHEDALDNLTFIAQQQQEELDRAIKLSRTNTMTSTEFTVGATDRANKVLAFDSSGEISVTQELGTFKGNSATITTAAFVQRDIVKSTTAAQLNNVYICVADSAIGDLLTDTNHWALLVDAVSAATSATAAASSATAAASSASTASTQASNASTSASTASTQATNSANSASASASSATAAAASAASAAASLDAFDDVYLGAKSSDPSTDNDGDALNAGDWYFNTSTNVGRIYNGSAFQELTVGTTATTTELNIMDGDTSASSTTVADADRVVLNDAGTMKQVAVTDLAAYFDDEITAMPNLVTTGALNSGSITSGFGAIDNGASAITTTGVITGGTLEATTDTAAGDNAAIGYTSAEGLILTGQGSTSDITLKNDADATVFTVPTGTDDILFPDSAKILMGAGSDLQLYHNGSASYISEQGTGNLVLGAADSIIFQNAAHDENMLVASQNGAVSLYYDNALKLATSSTGCTITGGFTATAASTITTSDNATQLTLESTDADANSGPQLDLHRNSASPADNDVLGALLYTGKSSTGADKTYSSMNGFISNVANANASGGLIFNTRNSDTLAERLRITSAGDVGIGRSDPENIVGSHGGGLVVKSASGRAATTTAVAFQDSSGNSQFQQLHNGQTTFSTGSTERMRLDTSGNLFIAKTSDTSTGVGITLGAAGFIRAVRNETIGVWNRQGSDGTVFVFARSDSGVGSIDVTTSGTAYNTSSDRRLKSNIEDAASASDKIDAIQVRQFDWNVDDSHQDYGLIAQELQSIEPLAVSGNADSDEMMGVDYSKLVPMLIKEIQELRGRVAALEAN